MRHPGFYGQRHPVEQHGDIQLLDIIRLYKIPAVHESQSLGSSDKSEHGSGACTCHEMGVVPCSGDDIMDIFYDIFFNGDFFYHLLQFFDILHIADAFEFFGSLFV